MRTRFTYFVSAGIYRSKRDLGFLGFPLYYTETTGKLVTLPLPEGNILIPSKKRQECKDLALQMLRDVCPEASDTSFESEILATLEASYTQYEFWPEINISTYLTSNYDYYETFELNRKNNDLFEEVVNLVGFEHLLSVGFLKV